MSEIVTDGIRVQVDSQYVPSRSNPSQKLWFFVYQVTIENRGEQDVQLLSRHWIITNANGHEEHVRGPGVVGDQPLIPPGDSYVYSSACPLNTSMGSMRGSYQMVDQAGRLFDAEIAPFLLADPLDMN